MARVRLTKKIIKSLWASRRRTGVGATKLLSGRDDLPEGFKIPQVATWMAGSVSTVPEDHLVYVQDAWAALPTDRWIEIDEAVRRELQTERLRTGVGFVRLLKEFGPLPDDLSPQMVHGWANGAVKSVRRRHLTAVRRSYRKIPDGCQNTRRPVDGEWERIEVTPVLRRELREIHNRLPSGYLRGAPRGFTPVQMAHILSGRDKTISRLVLGFLRNHPCRMTVMPKPNCTKSGSKGVDGEFPPRREARRSIRQYPGTVYIEITEGMHRRMHEEVRRTGLTPSMLFRTLDDVPIGLTSRLASCWLSGRIGSAEQHYLEYFFQSYANLPDLL